MNSKRECRKFSRKEDKMNLINSLSFTPNFLAYAEGVYGITFYAMCILAGALVALFLASFYARKDGFSWDFFLTIFVVAFPLGIVGARIWYVIAEWSKSFAGKPWYEVFNIRGGGLAIQGGAILGVASGIIFAFFRRRNCSLLKAADFAVPGILVAQAMGRWGNFFNQEVFGRSVNPEAWSFLPSFITNNMYIESGNLGFCTPLFFVEGLFNISFFFLIVYGYKGIFKQFYKYGDLSFLYFISYGIIRMILEPMRNKQFIMGSNEDSMKSFSMALAFILVGLILLIANHVIRYLHKKGYIKENKFIRFILRRDYETKHHDKLEDVKEFAGVTTTTKEVSSPIKEAKPTKEVNKNTYDNSSDDLEDELAKALKGLDDDQEKK